MISFSDLSGVSKMFENAFGTNIGQRLWRWFFGIAVLVALSFCFSELGNFGKAAIFNAKALFSSSVAKAQVSIPSIGNDNTIVGVPPPVGMGSGNTIVGTTDSRGNSILNRGGIAIGAGACADQTTVAIGAGANAGACVPGK